MSRKTEDPMAQVAVAAKQGRLRLRGLPWLAMGAACLLGWACESRSGGPPATASTPPSTVAPTTASTAQPTEQAKAGCVPALDDQSKTVRIFGTGSHADAKTNVTIELASGKMTGTTFELDGSKVTPVKVDDTLRPEELTKLKKALAATCVELKQPPADAEGVPGGYSYLEIVGGRTVWVVFGTPNEKMPSGGRYASVSRDEWQRIVEAYPKLRPSERGAAAKP